MKCHYEELGIERDASDSDIKTAYRKLALRWHPDKNPECIEEAKQRFLLIQQAYEVLNDPQERAFYDKHRESILRGKNSSYEDNCLNVFEYFTVTCFKGFGDNANGFYAVYKEVFDKIATEDAEFMDDEANIEAIPTFGNSQSSYEDVVGPFYAYWSAYCTKKTYSWLCPYDIVEAKERRTMRAIDREMKKIVQRARKDRNDEVRSLVAFVRKRDKRVQEYNQKLEERAILNRQKQEQRRLDQLQKRQRELQEMQNNSKSSAFDETYEARLKELEQQYGGSSSEYDEEDDEFKGYVIDDINATYIGEVDDAVDEDEDEEEEISNKVDNFFCVACNKKFKHKRAFVSHESNKKHLDNLARLRQADEAAEDEKNINELADNEATLSMEEETITQNKQKKKSKKSKCIQSNELEMNLTDLPELLVDATKLSDEDEWTDKRSAKKKKSKNPNEANTTHKPAECINSIITKATKSAADDVDDVEALNELHACATCNKQFNSKNKLFTHLKSTNHSIYLPGKGKSVIDVESNSKKGRGKRK